MSNVWQGYDYCFARDADMVFMRMFFSESQIDASAPRREMFARMEAAGIATVPNGTVVDLLRREDPGHGLVVYVDERAHRGGGKVRMSCDEALNAFPNAWASVFVPPAGQSLRHFQFGARSFSMPAWSVDDWRCQRGEAYTYCVPGSRWNLFPTVVPYPYFAVDFIPGTDLATDFDFLPGMTDDGLETWMTPRQMHSSLCEAAAVILDRHGRVFGDVGYGYGLAFAKDLPLDWRETVGCGEFDHFSELDHLIEREG